MSMDKPTNKRKRQSFTIIKDDPTDGHGGYGGGSISLEHMSPVIVDPNEKTAYVDMDAMHARSAVERRVRYHSDKAEVPNGLLYWIVWVTVEQGDHGPYYAGVTGSELLIDRPGRVGYKSMAQHVTHMEKSLKGKVIVEHMDEDSKKLLREFLVNFNEDLWKNSTEELKELLSK